jgi:hypothetical protein
VLRFPILGNHKVLRHEWHGHLHVEGVLVGRGKDERSGYHGVGNLQHVDNKDWHIDRWFQRWRWFVPPNK